MMTLPFALILALDEAIKEQSFHTFWQQFSREIQLGLSLSFPLYSDKTQQY